MTKRFTTLLLFISVFILSCSTYRSSLVKNGNKNQAIINTIIDFSNTSRLYKKHRVFEVEFIDTLYRKELKKIDEKNFHWLKGKPYLDIYVIIISPMTNEFTYLLSDSLPNYKNHLPTRYIEQDGKLFYWNDENYESNKKTIAVLKKYNVITENYLNPVFTVDETQKAVNYFVCRSDFTNYKKVTSHLAIGHFDLPETICE